MYRNPVYARGERLLLERAKVIPESGSPCYGRKTWAILREMGNDDDPLGGAHPAGRVTGAAKLYLQRERARERPPFPVATRRLAALRRPRVRLERAARRDALPPAGYRGRVRPPFFAASRFLRFPGAR